MSDEPKIETTEEPTIVAPICPNCGGDPLQIRTQELNIMQFKFMVMFCAGCRIFLSSTLIMVAQPQIARPTKMPLIIPPH